jgi:anti-sigma factor RsiW
MCEQREQVIDYLYDEVSPANRRDIERHLEGCDECRGELRAFRNVREDLLAWGVPNPPSVWKAFAPAPVVPWHKQVPAWALAAAASLMFILGTAGGFMAHNVVDARSQTTVEGNYGTHVPPQVAQAPSLDSKAIMALIREELAKDNAEAAGRVIPVGHTPDRSFQLDAKTEERLMSRIETMVNNRNMQQAVTFTDVLMQRWAEDYKLRKEDEMRYGQLKVLIDTVDAQVKQLAAAQTTKGQ